MAINFQPIANSVDALTAHFDSNKFVSVDKTPYYLAREGANIPIYSLYPIFINNSNRDMFASFNIRKHNNEDVVLLTKYAVYNQPVSRYQFLLTSIGVNDGVYFSKTEITQLSSSPIDFTNIQNPSSINKPNLRYYQYRNDLKLLSAYGNNIPLEDGTLFDENIPATGRIRKNFTLYQNTEEDKNTIKFHLYNRIADVQNTLDVEYGAKNLLYFTIFDCSSGFTDLLSYCLETIHNTTPVKNFDVLFITDENTKTTINSLSVTQFFNAKYLLVPEIINDGVYASLQKLKIYNFPEIENYNKILFLDADSVAVRDINSTFNTIISTNCLDTLSYTVAMTNPLNIVHSIKSFNLEELLYIQSSDPKPFNAGQFMFKNSLKMRKHFENVNWLYSVWPGPFFYEQSFMNYYFNIAAKNKICSDINNTVKLFTYKTPVSSFYHSDTSIIHLANSQHLHVKFDNMKKVVSDFNSYALQQTT